MAVRIERPVGPDEKIQPVMGRADRGQDQDDVVVAGRTRPVRHIADPEIANDFAALERQVAERQRLMRTIDPARLQRRMMPAACRAGRILILLAEAKPDRRELQECECRKSKFQISAGVVELTSRCCDAAASPRELRTICTFKRCVVGASLVVLSSPATGLLVPDLFLQKGRDRKGRQNGEGNDHGPWDRHCAARCISGRRRADHPRAKPDHHAAAAWPWLWAAIAGIGIDDIQKKIIQAGGVQYASAVIIIVFGAWFAQVLIQTGIAESVIRSAVELAGDRPLVTAMTITLVTALLFTSMYGVGAAIAIGVIALPIMMGQGIPPHVAAPAFTMGIGAGTFVNLVQFGTFQKLFPGIKYEAPLSDILGGRDVRLHSGGVAAGILLSAQRRRTPDGRRRRCRRRRRPGPQADALLHLYRADLSGAHDHGPEMGDHSNLHPLDRARAGADWRATARSRVIINLFNKTFFDAFPDIATIAALWTICGMIIVAGQTPEVAGALKPIFAPILPHTPLQAAVFFGLLGGIAQHLPRADGGDRHRRGIAGHHSRQQGHPDSVSLLDLARRRRCCKGAWIRPIHGRCGRSGTPRSATGSSSEPPCPSAA